MATPIQHMQAFLHALGHDNIDVDGKRGPMTNNALASALEGEKFDPSDVNGIVDILKAKLAEKLTNDPAHFEKLVSKVDQNSNDTPYNDVFAVQAALQALEIKDPGVVKLDGDAHVGGETMRAMQSMKPAFSKATNSVKYELGRSVSNVLKDGKPFDPETFDPSVDSLATDKLIISRPSNDGMNVVYEATIGLEALQNPSENADAVKTFFDKIGTTGLKGSLPDIMKKSGLDAKQMDGLIEQYSTDGNKSVLEALDEARDAFPSEKAALAPNAAPIQVASKL